MTRYLLPALALAVAILAGVAYCEGKRAANAQHVAQAWHATADTARAQKDSSLQREAAMRSERDSLRMALTASATRLGSLSRRITITAPGLIRLASDPVAGASAPPPVVVRVPTSVTEFMQAQSAQIAMLSRALAVADSGWTAADSVIAAQGRELHAQAKQIAALEHKSRHWYDRIGLCGGYGLAASPSGQVIHGATLGACVKVWP